MTIARRSFLTGFASLLAAPSIVRADSLMRISPPPLVLDGMFLMSDGSGYLKEYRPHPILFSPGPVVARYAVARIGTIRNSYILNRIGHKLVMPNLREVQGIVTDGAEWEMPAHTQANIRLFRRYQS